MPAVTPELEIERQLIEQLTSGESQGTYRPDLKNEGQLWDNFFEKLAQNNVPLLADHPLTSLTIMKLLSGWLVKMVLPKSRYSVKMLALGLSDFLSSGVTISLLENPVTKW